jgi:hypothetical protein
MLAVAYGQSGQRLTCPHRDSAVPTEAVSITILDLTGAEVLAATAATKGTLSAKLDGTTLAGARELEVDNAAGCSPGDTIILTDSYGETEVHTVRGVNTTSDIIQLEDRLHHDHAKDDTAKSATIYYSLNASSTGTWLKGGPYQAIWTCPGWSSPRATLFNVVDLATTNPVTLEHVRRWVPNLSTLRDTYDDPDLQSYRDNAWEMIRARLAAAARNPDIWRDADEVAVAGGLLAAGLFLLDHGREDLSRRLIGDEPPGEGGIFARYWGDLEKTPAWFDEDGDRSLDTYERRQPVSTTVGRGL